MTRFTNCFMNHSERATAGTSAAADSACARHTVCFMDAALCAASIFVTLILVGLLGLAELAVSILVLVGVIIVWGLIILRKAPSLEKANPVY